MCLLCLLWFLPSSLLEDVLQRELHDSRTQCGSDLTEGVAIQCQRVTCCDSSGGDSAAYAAGDEAIRHIERLGSDFEPLHFVNIKRPGERHIELPRARTRKTVPAYIAVRAQRWRRKGHRIDPLSQGTAGPVLIRIGEDLIRSLQAGTAQRLICAADDIE